MKTTPAPTDDEALALLRSTPAWADLEPDDEDGHARVERDLATLATLDDDALRRVVARYVEEAQAGGGLGVSAGSRIYVLVRYVYAAPPRAPGNVARFGAFHGVPSGDGWVDEQWPLASVDGQLRLTGRFGGYFGEDYLALEELDEFRRRYGRRTAP